MDLRKFDGTFLKTLDNICRQANVESAGMFTVQVSLKEIASCNIHIRKYMLKALRKRYLQINVGARTGHSALNTNQTGDLGDEKQALVSTVLCHLIGHIRIVKNHC